MQKENEIATIILDHSFRIHKQYGPGLYESVYENILVYELEREGLRVAFQVPIPIYHNDLEIPIAFRADIIVEDCVLVELKSVDLLPKTYYKQVITYLKLTGLKLGLLINFNVGMLKEGIHRIANNI